MSYCTIIMICIFHIICELLYTESVNILSFIKILSRVWVQNNSLPFNKYAFLTTHNAFAIEDGVPRLTFTNQEDNITQQLNVRYYNINIIG